MKKAGSLFLVFLLVILESTLVTRFPIRGIVPNLSLIAVVSFGLLEGPRWGRNIGFFVGLMQDILFCTYLGFFALLYFYIGHLSGYGHRILRKGNLLLPMVEVLGMDLLYGFSCYFFRFFLAGQIDLNYYMFRIIFPEAAYTALLTLPIYLPVMWIVGWMSRHRVRDMITRSLIHRERI